MLKTAHKILQISTLSDGRCALACQPKEIWASEFHIQYPKHCWHSTWDLRMILGEAEMWMFVCWDMFNCCQIDIRKPSRGQLAIDAHQESFESHFRMVQCPVT